MDNIEIRQEIRGEITSWWVQVPGHPWRCVGHVSDCTKAEAIERGIIAAKNDEAWDELEKKLRQEFPDKQIYGACAGSERDVDWTGYELGHRYIYVLKNRRKNGKYQIAQAYTI